MPAFFKEEKKKVVKAVAPHHSLCGSELMAGVSRKPLSDIERAYGDTSHTNLQISPSGSEITWLVTGGYEVTDMYGWQSNMKQPVHAGSHQLQKEGYTQEGIINLVPTTSKPVRATRVELCLAPMVSKESNTKTSSS